MWKSSGAFLVSKLCSAGLQGPSHMAPKMGHLYLSLLLGSWFPFQRSLCALGPSLQALLPMPLSLPSPCPLGKTLPLLVVLLSSGMTFAVSESHSTHGVNDC